MIVFILVAIVAVFFIAGISLVFKGYLNMPDLDNSDIIELEKGLDTVKTEGEKLNMELASTQKELCETRINLQEAKKLEDDVASLQDKEKRYVADISKLKKEFDEILSKADVQAKNAVEVINSLKGKEDSLAGRLKKQPAGCSARDPVPVLIAVPSQVLH